MRLGQPRQSRRWLRLMTYAHSMAGPVIHFPACYSTDATGVIAAPSAEEMRAIAANVRPDHLLLFTRGLWRSAKRKRHQARWEAVNEARRSLALLCAARAYDEGLPGDIGKALGGWREEMTFE